jgi:hypothetical protein
LRAGFARGAFLRFGTVTRLGLTFRASLRRTTRGRARLCAGFFLRAQLPHTLGFGEGFRRLGRFFAAALGLVTRGRFGFSSCRAFAAARPGATPPRQPTLELDQLGITPAGIAHVFESERQIGEIPDLAVAVHSREKTPSTLRCRCTPIRSNQRMNWYSLSPTLAPRLPSTRR